MHFSTVFNAAMCLNKHLNEFCTHFFKLFLFQMPERFFSGPAQVPMVLHNGAIPPILVPPGYILQVIEDEGVRRVVVLPNPQIFNMPMPHELAHSVPPSMLHPVPSFHANPYHPPVSTQSCLIMNCKIISLNVCGIYWFCKFMRIWLVELLYCRFYFWLPL